MSRLDDWDDPMSTLAVLGIIFGFTFLVVLVEKMSLLAMLAVLSVLALLVLGLGVLWLVSNRSDAEVEGEATRERDPLTVLQERYARGEISEETFEHQVTMLLDVDELAGREQESELVSERN